MDGILYGEGVEKHRVAEREELLLQREQAPAVHCLEAMMQKEITLRWQGVACRAGRNLEELLRWRRKEAPRAWVAKDGVADMGTRWKFSTNLPRVVPQRISLPLNTLLF